MRRRWSNSRWPPCSVLSTIRVYPAGAIASPYGPLMPAWRSVSTARATTPGYASGSSPSDGVSYGQVSVMPVMPAAAQPWKTARFSIIAICFAARSRSSNSRSSAPRSASSSSARDTVNGTRTSVSGRTRRCRTTAPSPASAREAEARVVVRPRSVAEWRQPCGPATSTWRRAARCVCSRSRASASTSFQPASVIGARPRIRWFMSVLFLEGADAERAVGGVVAEPFVDVLLRVDVADVEVAAAFVLPLELDEPAAELLAQAGVGVAPEVGEAFVLLLGHVLAVGEPGLVHRRVPGGAADGVQGGFVDAVADVDVVADGVERLLLGVVAATQQLGVENFLLGAGVHVEQVGQGLPDLRQVGGGGEVVEPGELAPEPVVVVEDEAGDVGHAAFLPSSGARETRPLWCERPTVRCPEPHYRAGQCIADDPRAPPSLLERCSGH